MLALPSRVTTAPSPTVWSGPAFAAGASFAPAVTVTVTVSVSDLSPSLTVRVKVSDAFAASWDGAVKVGFAVVAPVRITSGVPSVWDQEYVRVSPESRSLLPLPSRVTLAPSATVWSAPALAAGWLLFLTVIVTSSAVDSLLLASVTLRVNVMGVSPLTSGAVKVGLTVVAPVRVTVGVTGGVRSGGCCGSMGMGAWTFWAQA